MATIVRWTGREARALREALRMSVRDFSAHTNISTASIADMEAKGEQTKLRYSTQRILDEVHATASAEVQQRFDALLGARATSSYPPALTNAAEFLRPDNVVMPDASLGTQIAGSATSASEDRVATVAMPFGLGAGPVDGEVASELRERRAKAIAVDRRAVELLAIQVNHIREVDRCLGAQVAQAQLRGHLAALDQLRSFTVLPRQRQPLADLYADAAALAGWQCLDLGDLDESWRRHEAAKHAGREGSSPAALNHALAQQAYVLVEAGDPTSAADLAEHARGAAGTAVPPLLQAWLWAVVGELRAMLGDGSACRRAFENAGLLLPADAHDPDLPYIILSTDHLARWRGNALAQLGDPTAIRELRDALDTVDHSFTRARAGMHVDLAAALLTAGRHQEARVELEQAGTLARQVGSARQSRRARHLAPRLQAA